MAAAGSDRRAEWRQLAADRRLLAHKLRCASALLAEAAQLGVSVQQRLAALTERAGGSTGSDEAGVRPALRLAGRQDAGADAGGVDGCGTKGSDGGTEQSSADSEEAAAVLHQMLAEAGTVQVRVYLLVEPRSTAVPVDLPLDATLLQLKAAARREGAPIPALQQLTVGGRLVAGSDSAPLSATLVRPNGVVSVRAKPPCGRISAANEHVVVLLASGDIDGWGNGEFWNPVPVFTGSVVSVHAGRGVTAAVVDGEVQCWGKAPVGPVVRQPRGQRVVSCSVSASCYGAVAAVCDGGYLHLSVRAEKWFGAPPACLQGRAAAVSCGGTLVAVLTREGAVFAFGSKLQCTEADFGGMAAVHVSAGGSHYGALMGDGSVRCFGANDCGQCDVPSELRNSVVSIACGAVHTAALLSDGSVLSWGKSAPDCDIVRAGPCVAVAAGDHFTVAATVGGKLVASVGEEGFADPLSLVPPIVPWFVRVPAHLRFGRS